MLFSFALTTVLASGCTALDLPVLTYAKPSSPEYRSIEPSFQLEPFNSEQAYYSVRQARSQNSIVLEVAGDSTPVRVFPLPPGQKSVFVSDLLNQTGIQKKFGSLKATLFRYSPDSIGGLRMEVKMAPDGRSVRPVSDYALHAGDRLRVDKATSPALTGLVNMMLGRQSN
jgi:hypothetical protein